MIQDYGGALLVRFTAVNFTNRYRYLQLDQNKSYIGSFDKWIDAIYKLKTGKVQLDKVGDSTYIAFGAAVRKKEMELRGRTGQIREMQQKAVSRGQEKSEK